MIKFIPLYRFTGVAILRPSDPIFLPPHQWPKSFWENCDGEEGGEESGQEEIRAEV